MAIKFKPVKRLNPFNPNDPVRYYPSPVYSDRVNLRRLAKEISARTSFNSADILGVLEAMTDVLPFFLANGSIVDLGEFGTFRLSLQGTSAKKPEKVTSENITGYRLLFRPGREMSDRLKQTEPIKVNK
jgi:predicted histone-like DNA-binding protein